MTETPDLKKMAGKANGETWKYLTKPELGEDEKVQMLTCAYSSLYLWALAGGTTLHYGRGHWLISRVLCVLGEAKLAEHHFKLCRTYTDMSDDKKDFDLVYAAEAEARVAALKGDKQKASDLKRKATEMAAAVKDPEDREIVTGDVAAEPWFGVP